MIPSQRFSTGWVGSKLAELPIIVLLFAREAAGFDSHDPEVQQVVQSLAAWDVPEQVSTPRQHEPPSWEQVWAEAWHVPSGWQVPDEHPQTAQSSISAPEDVQNMGLVEEHELKGVPSEQI